MKYILNKLKEGLLSDNPTFVQFLGMCPTLALTTSAANGFGMGIAVIAVLICSNMLISLCRKVIPDQVRIVCFITIISGFVTAVEMIIKAFFPAIDASLGIYIPLIVVNCIILARAEAFASRNSVGKSALDGLAMGLGFTCALTLIGFVRELVGAGTIFTGFDGSGGIKIPETIYKPAIIFCQPAGAFMTLGLLVALIAKIRSVKKAHDTEKKLEEDEMLNRMGYYTEGGK